LIVATTLALALSACGGDKPAADTAAAPADATSPDQAAAAPAASASTDPEIEQLKTVKPVEACAWLTPEKLSAAFPGLKFEVHQKLDPQMSGYTWDSRCTYWAGVGTIDFAKDVPTHTVEIFVNTVVSADKAKANLVSRAETAKTATGYQPQTALGPNAYTVTSTGVAMLFFVKGQSEVQMNFSDLKSPSAEKVKKLLEIAQGL
jgi:hypothetical protein